MQHRLLVFKGGFRDAVDVSRRDVTLGVLVALVWGVNFVVIDEGLQGVPPLFFAAVRFALVALLIVAVPRPACPWRYIVAVGIFMSAGQFGLLYLALSFGMPPGAASLVLQAQVPFTIVLATLTFGEPVSRRKRGGVAIALCGLAVIILNDGGALPLLGLVLTVAAAVSWAIGNVASRKGGARGLSMVAWSALAAPLPLLAISAVIEGPSRWLEATESWGWAQTWSTRYTVLIATVVGFGIWNGLLARLPASNVVPFALLVPVAGLLSAWVIQHAVPTTWTVVGGVVLVFGAAVAVAPWSHRAHLRRNRLTLDR